MWDKIKTILVSALAYSFLALIYVGLPSYLLYSCVKDSKKESKYERPSYSDLEEQIEDLERSIEKEQEKNGEAYEKIENAIRNLSDVIDDDEVDGYIYLDLLNIKETLTDALNDLE